MVKMRQKKLIENPIRSNKRWEERQRAKRFLHQLGAEMKRIEEMNNEHR